jgi:regulatory protein
MKVTKLVPQIKAPDRVSVFIDHKFSFGLSQVALVSSGLRIGQELTRAQLVKIKKLASDDKLYQAALRLVASYPKSASELELYLTRKGATTDLSQDIVKRLKAIGLIDDTNYATRLASHYRQQNHASRRKIASQLKKKRFSEDATRTALAGLDNDQAALAALITKKKDRYNDKLKLMKYLSRQGFSYEDIKHALEDQA